MSRPPFRRDLTSPRGIDPETGRGRYFGPCFADLVALADTLARERHGLEIPDRTRGLARSMVEVPALFAHTLGEHQSHYAEEAFLATARRSDSLVAHARRLAYTPDHGIAATGLATFTVKPGLRGTVPVNFALQSEPEGEPRHRPTKRLNRSMSMQTGMQSCPSARWYRRRSYGMPKGA